MRIGALPADLALGHARRTEERERKVLLVLPSEAIGRPRPGSMRLPRLEGFVAKRRDRPYGRCDRHMMFLNLAY